MVISLVQWILFSTPMRVEADEIGAAAEEDVLAVVDDFVDAGMQIGGGAAAEVAAALDELHAVAGFGESAGGAHAGYAAADDGDGAWFELLRALRASVPQGAQAARIKSRSFARTTDRRAQSR